jgi:hypothetical protein
MTPKPFDPVNAPICLIFNHLARANLAKSAQDRSAVNTAAVGSGWILTTTDNLGIVYKTAIRPIGD